MELEREKKSVNGFGIASLVLGIIILLVICFLKFPAILSVLCAVIGLVFGILGITVLRDCKKGIAIAGTAVCGLALTLGLFMIGVSILDLFGNNHSNGNSYSVQSGYNNSEASEETDDYSGDDTYENNRYFDITSKEYYSVTGGTVYIHKYKGKKDAKINVTMYIFDKSGNAIDKSSDSANVMKDETGYFKFFVEKKPEEIGEFDCEAVAKKADWTDDEEAGVELTKYNVSDGNLYLTFVQKSEELDYFSEYKLLYYKGGKLVGSDNGYFSSKARNLNGINTTDIAEIWLSHGLEFDKIEYYFEP